MILFLAALNAAVVLGAPYLVGQSLVTKPVEVLMTASLSSMIFILCQIRRDFARSLDEAIKAFLIGFAIFYLLAYVYGAFLVQSFRQNAAWAFWMSSLTMVPATMTLGPLYQGKEQWLRVFRHRHFQSSTETGLFYGCLGLLAGNWLACVVIPLDWGRAWQRWPIPNALGGSIGYLLATILVSCCHCCWTGERKKKAIRTLGGAAPMVDVDLSNEKMSTPGSSSRRHPRRQSSPARKTSNSPSKRASPSKRHVTISPKKTFIEPEGGQSPRRTPRSRRVTSAATTVSSSPKDHGRARSSSATSRRPHRSASSSPTRSSPRRSSRAH